jgi:hypothetical protein
VSCSVIRKQQSTDKPSETSSCCPNGQNCGGFPIQTTTVNNYVTNTALITTTSQQTATETLMSSVTVQSTTTYLTTFTLTTTSNGQTITYTTVSTVTQVLTLGVYVITPAPAASQSGSPSVVGSGSNNTGAIVGGVVGGIVFLSLLALLLFVGFRRGWFDRKTTQPLPFVPASDHYGPKTPASMTMVEAASPTPASLVPAELSARGRE